MDKPLIRSNEKIGHWTVLDIFVKKEKGEKIWLCRCDCGTERYVLERSLRHGGSLSCGCLRKEKLRESVGYDLSGKVFGDLTVLHQTQPQNTMKGIWWLCRCSCGNTYACPGTLLVTGRRTHCGCKTKKNIFTVDISGQKFNRLTALYPTEKRSPTGGVIWHCQCDCGNEIDVAYNNLVYCNMKSCGCQKREHDAKLKDFLVHVDGTSLDAIKSKKVPADNTTGYKGVYLIKGKYVAKIVFQKKAYHLGTYDNIEDAARARKEAEEILFGGVSEYYERYRKCAEADPEWARKNPVKINVSKVGNELSVTITPVLAGLAGKEKSIPA